jgi:hypothetical protein
MHGVHGKPYKPAVVLMAKSDDAERMDAMHPLISLEITELRQRELRVDAERTRLAAAASHRRSRISRLWRIATRQFRGRTSRARGPDASARYRPASENVCR